MYTTKYYTLSLHDALPIWLYRFQGGELTLVVEEQHVKMSDWLKLLEKQREHILFVSPDISLYKEEINRSLRSEEHTSELQSRGHLVCRLLLEKKKKNKV